MKELTKKKASAGVINTFVISICEQVNYFIAIFDSSLMLAYFQCSINQLLCVTDLFTNHSQQFVWIQVCPHFAALCKKGKQLLACRVASIRW